MDAKAFLRAKTLEMRQRHTKYEDTPYSLEPNCKESPGGLRDLQVVIWVARAANLGKSWNELAHRGLITPFEVKQLQRNEGVLKLIRARLHIVAGRREDRLVFDLQTAVAQSFGYEATKTQRASEVLMRRYYWAAKAVTQLNQILMLNIEEQINGSQDAPMRPINARFLDRGGMLEVASDDLYARDPHAILETFLVYQQTPGIQGLSARTLRALYNSRDLMNGAFRRDLTNRALFMRILEQPNGQTHAFRLMNQTSVLGRYLWVFRRIVGQMQHDLFHVYTVDQHILMVLRNVRRFFIPEHAHEYPFCSQLAVAMGQAVDPLHRGALPRRGEGSRRRSFGPRCARSAPLLPRSCDRRRRCIADRVPREVASDDVAHRAEGGSLRSRSDRGFCEAAGQRAPPDGAVPADGGRHPRHQPEGLERMEGQAARGPVPFDAARARRRPTQCRRGDRVAQAGSAAHAEPVHDAAGHRGAAVETRSR